MSFLSSLTPKQQTLAALAFFAILIAVFYGNTLGNGFVMDDTGQIERNFYLQSLENIPRVFTGCIWEAANRGCEGRSFYYRPMHYLAMILTYQISSEPWIFHVMNLVYYAIIVSLVFTLARVLTKNFWIAFFAALIYLMHPLHAEVVNWASAAPELMHTIFMLAAAIMYIAWRRKSSLPKFLGFYALFFLAVLSKEPALLLPVIFAALDVLYFHAKPKYFLQKDVLMRYAAFGIIILIYIIARNAVLGVGPQYGTFTLVERFHAIIALFGGEYIRKLFTPYPLVAFYEFKKSAEFFTPQFILSLGATLAFAGAFFYSALRKKNPLITFSLLWFAVFLSPVLILLGGVGEHVFSDRYLFAPSLGFALIGGWILERLLHNLRIPPAIPFAVLGVVSIAALFIVIPRNGVWKNNEVFYTTTLAQNANAHILRRELGEILLLKGDAEGARYHYEYLLENAPEWKDITMAYKGMGDYWRQMGDGDRALEFYVKATETGFSARDFVVYNDVGTMYMERGEYLKGFSYFCQSLQLLPELNPAQDNFQAAIGVLEEQYIREGTLREAITEQFTPVPEENIKYLDRRCDGKSCQFGFALNPASFDVLPPFLIVATAPGATKKNAFQPVEITNSGFDPEQRVIILETDTQYKDAGLTFVFPTCSRLYYEVDAAR